MVNNQKQSPCPAGPRSTYTPSAITLVAVTLATLLAISSSALIARLVAAPAAVPTIHYAPEHAR
jgi:hypothetical protein